MVIETEHGASLFLGASHGREEQARKDRDDGDHNQELNERERCLISPDDFHESRSHWEAMDVVIVSNVYALRRGERDGGR